MQRNANLKKWLPARQTKLVAPMPDLRKSTCNKELFAAIDDLPPMTAAAIEQNLP